MIIGTNVNDRKPTIQGIRNIHAAYFSHNFFFMSASFKNTKRTKVACEICFAVS